jgi:hypothetical protein
MLTRNDATVDNALDLVETARVLGLRDIGLKDGGAGAPMLKRLTAIRDVGVSPWTEVASTAREPNCAPSRLAETSASIA